MDADRTSYFLTYYHHRKIQNFFCKYVRRLGKVAFKLFIIAGSLDTLLLSYKRNLSCPNKHKHHGHTHTYTWVIFQEVKNLQGLFYESSRLNFDFFFFINFRFLSPDKTASFSKAIIVKVREARHKLSSVNSRSEFFSSTLFLTLIYKSLLRL